MTATTDVLGQVHERLAAIYLEMVSVREEPLFDKEGQPLLHPETGEPLTRKVYPTAAELTAANAFLKANNITAVVGKSDALDELQRKLAEKRAASRNRPAVADPYAQLPEGFGGLQ